jgi:hypothetical protein
MVMNATLQEQATRDDKMVVRGKAGPVRLVIGLAIASSFPPNSWCAMS